MGLNHLNWGMNPIITSPVTYTFTTPTVVEAPGVEPGSEDFPTQRYTSFFFQYHHRATTTSVKWKERSWIPGLKDGLGTICACLVWHDADK